MCFSRSAVGQPKKGRYRYLYPLKLPNCAKTANRSLDFNVKRYPSDSILRTIPLDLVVESWVKIDSSSDNTSGQLLGPIFGFDSSNNTSKLIPLTIPLNLYYHYSTTAMVPSIATLLHSSIRLRGDYPFFPPFRSIRVSSLSCCFSALRLSATPQLSITCPSILWHSHVTSLPSPPEAAFYVEYSMLVIQHLIFCTCLLMYVSFTSMKWTNDY